MNKNNNLKLPTIPKRILSFVLDVRFLQIVVQLIFIVVLVSIGFILYKNLTFSMQKSGYTLGYSFLKLPAGFAIIDRLVDFSPSDTNLRAIYVGLLNAVLVSFLGIVLSTILGIITGIALLSSNFFARKIATVYVEVLRNVPLLLAILATYSLILFSIPRVENALILGNTFVLSNRGFVVPLPIPSETWIPFLIMNLTIALLIIVVSIILIRKKQKDGWIVILIGLLVYLVFSIVIFQLFQIKPFTWDLPFKQGLNFKGGRTFSPEFIALLVGLVLGSSPYIADTVRAGIQSVGKGQREAAQAIGLNGYQTFRLVIFPQAMRVIVPPMTSNYLGITKNSSLAAAIAFPELFGISGTIINQTGRAIEMMAFVMLIYLTLSILTSLFMNWYNERVRIVER